MLIKVKKKSKTTTMGQTFSWCKLMSLRKRIIQNVSAGSQHGVNWIARGWEIQLHRTTQHFCKGSFKTLSSWIWRMFVAKLLKGSLTVQGWKLWAIKFCNLFLPTEEKGHMFLQKFLTSHRFDFYLTYKL